MSYITLMRLRRRIVCKVCGKVLWDPERQFDHVRLDEALMVHMLNTGHSQFIWEYVTESEP